MTGPRVLLAAACLLPLTLPYGIAHADTPPSYCALPADPPGLGPIAWLKPFPPPTAPEPLPDQRAEYAGFPNVTAIDVVDGNGRPARKVITTWSTNVDMVMNHTSEAAASDDDGETFDPPRDTPLREAPIQLLDGRLFGTQYYLSVLDVHTSLATVLTAGPGQGWTYTPATFTTPDELDGGGVAHGLPIQLPDGTILVSVYAPYASTGTFQAEVYASRDGGQTFTRRGVIAPPSGGYTYNEAAIEQVADGSLLAVLRRDGGTYSTLHYSRSEDGGTTWSPVDDLRFAGQDCVVRGVAPRLLLMPNGALVLSAGRPDVWLAVSPDGRGDSWEPPRVTYHNRDGVYDRHGSSGYTGIAAVGPNRLVQVFDNCKLPGVRPDGTLNETACPDSGRFENGSGYAVKRRHLDVLPPDPGRIDLAALARHGAMRVDTDMTWSGRAHPRARPDGAFDGSTAYWSGAVARGPGTYVIHLDRDRVLSRVGLSLRPGHAAGAKVYVSRDGTRWGRPVVTVANRVDYALRYSALPGGVRGRHVKIVTTATRGCDPEVGPRCSMLNEVELYAEG